MSKKYPQLNDKAWLYQKYWVEKLSHQKIAQIIGCGRTSVRRAFRVFNIPSRTISEASKGELSHNYGKHFSEVTKKKMSAWQKNRSKYQELNNKEWIYQRYIEERLSLKQIAKILETGDAVILRALKKFNISCRTKSEALKGRKSPMLGKRFSEETRQKMREARKHRTFSTIDTKPELIFIDFYHKFGIADRVEDTRNNSFHIGRLNPDFIIRDMRIAIFINGDYWHSALLRPNLKHTHRPENQIKICKRHKWKAIIIWESDIKRKDAEQFVLAVLHKEGIIE